MNPLVSIIIPVYNGSNYLAEAIDSALAQTYSNIEIIVVNDGSNDDGATERVALSYGDKIRYIVKENGGVSSALNTGICEMKGDYFSWLSHDDLYAPEKVARQVSLIKTEKDIILCSGSLIDSNGSLMRSHIKAIEKTLSGAELLNEHINGYALNGLGFLVPKTAFEKAGLFDESMRYLQDLDMWLRMMWFDFRFICHRDLLVFSRIHPSQQTNTISHLYARDSKKLDEKHIEGLKKLQSDSKGELLKNYLYRFSRSHSKEEFRAVMSMLNEHSGIATREKLNCIIYYIKGGIKRFYRQIRDLLYRLKKVRN